MERELGAPVEAPNGVAIPNVLVVPSVVVVPNGAATLSRVSLPSGPPDAG